MKTGTNANPASMPSRRGDASILPAAAQLAAVGIVLCLRRRHDRELDGWGDALRARSCTVMDSDGVRESICFDDAAGRCCWRMYLLPDSDFLAWEQLAASLSPSSERTRDPGLGERLWMRLAGHVHCGAWRASALRLHVLPPAHADAACGPRLGASVVALSTLGAAVARRIVRAEGAECGAWVEVDHRTMTGRRRAHAASPTIRFDERGYA